MSALDALTPEERAEFYLQHRRAHLRTAALGYALERLVEQALVRRIVVAAPSAGAEISFVFPPGGPYEILDVYTTFVTSAVATNRTPTLFFQTADSASLGRFANPGTITASQNYRISFTAGMGTSINSAAYCCPLPSPPLTAFVGDRLSTNTSSLDSGDQYSGVVVVVRNWTPSFVTQQIDLTLADLDSANALD